MERQRVQHLDACAVFVFLGLSGRHILDGSKVGVALNLHLAVKLEIADLPSAAKGRDLVTLASHRIE
jgi:hypothetical protein